MKFLYIWYSANRIILVYKEGNLTSAVVTQGKLVNRTLCFSSWSSTNGKLGCSIKMEQFTMKFQLESDVCDLSVKEAKVWV